MKDNLLNCIIEGIQEKKGKEIIDINLSKFNNTCCDHFIICHGDSRTQVEAIAGSVEKITKEKLSIPLAHREGTENAQWILLDYHHIIVHIFQKEVRHYYNLEELWADADIKEIECNY